MNAIVALCYFCEFHGPKIVFCTRPDYNRIPGSVFAEKHPDLASATSNTLNKFPVTTNSNHDEAISHTEAERQTAVSPDASSTGSKQKVPDACEACSSIAPGQPHFISIDDEAKISYISSPYPHQPELYSLLRQACVRSLSSEVCGPGREGPFFFGDDTNGSNVLSYTFFIDDCEARGLHRWYSIVVMMMDKIFLLNSWPFLVSSIGLLIEELKRLAHKVFLEEEAQSRPRAKRLQISMTPDKFRQMRGTSSATSRSLVDLTKDKQIFQRLHRAFVCLLHAGGRRLRERLLEGPPTEDSVVDLENQEETEEGFVKVFSTKLSVDEQVSEGDSEEFDAASTAVTCESLRQLVRIVGYEQFHCIAYHIIIGNQVIVRSDARRLVRSIIDCLKVILPKGCCKIVYYDKQYKDTWQCNFLGLPLKTSVPMHIEHCILIDILPPCAPSLPDKYCAAEGAELPIDLSAACLADYSFRVHSPFILPEDSPAILTKLENAIMDERLTDDVIALFLLCLKEEWMNKVKVLFKFTKAGGGRTEEETRKLLKVVGAQAEDNAVLKFWQTGLSNQYKNHMLSQAVGQSIAS